MHLLIRRTKEFFEGKCSLDLSQWDVGIPYFEFRRQLRAIAEMSFGQNFESIIPWSDQNALCSLKPGSWVLPINEEDWLHPDFFKSIQKFRIPDKANFMTWGVLRKEADGAGPKDQPSFVENCGYALKLPTDWKFIVDHRAISQQPIKEMHHVKPVLAIRNQTPASTSFLSRRDLTPRNIIEISVRNRRCDQRRLYEWTRPQANAYYELLEKALG